MPTKPDTDAIRELRKLLADLQNPDQMALVYANPGLAYELIGRTRVIAGMVLDEIDGKRANPT